MIDRDHNGGRVVISQSQRNARWNGPFDLARVAQSLTQCENTFPILFRLLTKTTTATTINVARSSRLIFNIQEGGRKREIDREEEVISIMLIPRDFAVLGYWFQAGLWSMLKTVRVCSLVNGFSREFQTNEDWKSLELEIGTMISFEGKKRLIFFKNCQERLKNYIVKK